MGCEELAVSRFFEKLLAIQALTQMQIAQHCVIRVSLQQGNGSLCASREGDVGGASTGKNIPQDAAHTFIVLND
jgi:hypothetical protein